MKNSLYKARREHKIILPILLVTLISCVILLNMGFVNAFDWETNIIGYWDFDENTGTNAEDITDGQHNFTLTGSTGWDGGFINTGFNTSTLEGSVSSHEDFNLSGSFSISLWVNKTHPLMDNSILIRYESFKGWQLGGDGSNGLMWQIDDGGVGDERITIHENNLTLNQWTHIIITGNRTPSENQTTFYINGEKILNGSLTRDPTITKDIVIGGWINGDGDFDSIVDELGMWKRVLSPTEVTELYNEGEGLQYNQQPHDLFTVINETYEASTYETASETFQLIISYNKTNYTSAKARFWYNYTPTGYFISGSGYGLGANESKFTVGINIPLVDATVNNKFFWEVILSNASGTEFLENTTQHTQEAEALTMNLCNATYNIPFINFSFSDEELGTSVNGTFSGTFLFSRGGGTGTKTYNFINITSVGNPSYDFCFSPAFLNYTISASIEYSGATYVDRTYYLNNATLTNSSTLINLYQFNSSNAQIFYFNVQQDLLPFNNAVITIAKYIVGEGIFKTIGIRETDNNGEFIEYLDLNKDYRFFIVKDGVSYGSIDRTAICSVTPCEITLEIEGEPFDFWEGYGDYYAGSVTYDLSYNDTSKFVTFNFVDITGLANYFRLLVTRMTGNSTAQVICNTTLYSSSGSLSCNITDYTGDFKATAYVSRSPELIVDIFMFINKIVKDILGNDALVIALFIIIAVGLVGAWSTSSGVMMTAFAMLMMKIMGFVAMGWTSIALIIMIAFILIIKMKV